MIALISLQHRFINKYLRDIKDFTGFSYFMRSYCFAQCYCAFYFREKIDIESMKQFNTMFREYWEMELTKNPDARDKLIELYKLASLKEQYIFDSIKRLRKKMESEDLQMSFNPGRWSPLCIGIETFD